jgi:hypothetical protein
MMDDQQNLEAWLRMYEEQVRHARHHEVLRTQSTNLVVLISAALLALYGSDSTTLESWILGIFIAAVNLYGLLMSLKHYERSRLHVKVGSEYRAVISKNSPVGGENFNDVRGVAHEAHQSLFGTHKIRAYMLWSGLHLVLLVIGILMAVTVIANGVGPQA